MDTMAPRFKKFNLGELVGLVSRLNIEPMVSNVVIGVFLGFGVVKGAVSIYPVPMDKIWLGVDWGRKRIGLAVSDPTGTIASPLKALQVTGDNSAVRRIAELLPGLGVQKVVIGLPISMNGADSAQTTQARSFAAKLAGRTNTPVLLLDERLTSRQAERELIGMGVRRDQRRETVDSVAASLILQSALQGASLTPVVPGASETHG